MICVGAFNQDFCRPGQILGRAEERRVMAHDRILGVLPNTIWPT